MTTSVSTGGGPASIVRPPPSRRRSVAAVLGLTAMVAYASLKVAWALGSGVGITDIAAWDRAFGDFGPVEHWLALWGTVVLAAFGAVLLLLVLADGATPVGRPPLRRPFRALAWVIAVVVGAFAVVALISTILSDVAALRDGSDPSPMAAWVYYGVYASFLAYAGALAGALVPERGRTEGRVPPQARPRGSIDDL